MELALCLFPKTFPAGSVLPVWCVASWLERKQYLQPIEFIIGHKKNKIKKYRGEGLVDVFCSECGEELKKKKAALKIPLTSGDLRFALDHGNGTMLIVLAQRSKQNWSSVYFVLKSSEKPRIWASLKRTVLGGRGARGANMTDRMWEQNARRRSVKYVTIQLLMICKKELGGTPSSFLQQK